MKQLNIMRWSPEGVAGPIPRATVEEGTTPEDFLKPEFWAHVGAKMRRFMMLEILDECGEWIAEAYVADCGRTWARVVVKSMTVLAGAERVVEPVGYKVEYRAHDKHRIRRLSDNTIIATGFESKSDAERHLIDHLKALAA